MELIVINDNPYGQNIYVYFDSETREGVVIDSGDSFETVRKVLEQNDITLKAILLTHGHFDHTFSVNELRALTNAPVYAHVDETELLRNAEYNRSSLRGIEIIVEADKHFSDGDVFEISANGKLKVIHTAGHTAGGVCYYDEENAFLFTGDTLFKETIGRTDMPTGNHDTLLKSIREKLFILPENVTVFAGHEDSSTIAHEKKYNRAI